MQTLKFLTENLNKENIKWTSINDEYLTQYNLIEGSYFGLPVDIEFDNNNTYQQANIPLSLFFRNSYLKEEKWLPIEVEIPTNIVFETMSLDITIDDYYTIREFVVKNQKLLKLVSENKISSISFINQCQQPININNKLLTEMPNLHSDITGVPEKIWIDCGGTYKKGGHWIRVKVGDGGNNGTLTIPDYKWIGGENISEKHKKLIEKYVKLNVDLITQATLGQITFSQYIANSIKIDNKGLPIKKIKIKDWVIYLMFGDIQIYKSNGLPTRFLVTKNGNMESLYKNEDGQPMLFDSIFYLGENEQKCYCTLRGISYWLFSDGTLKEIETNF